MSSGDVVLVSGGVDSMVCAELSRLSGRLRAIVFVDYGHPAQIPEGWKVFAYHGKTGVPLRVVHAFGLDIGEMASAENARIVPARNLWLIALAANVAAAVGAERVVIGANAGDEQDYPDCRAAAVEAFSRASMVYGIEVVAPLASWAKAQVVSEARRLGITRDDTWYCYGSGPNPCGTCPCCERSDAAWSEAPC